MNIQAGIDFELSDDTLFLPKPIFDKYSEIDITSVFQWQADCLKIPGVLDGVKNLVYCAPTSAGKTLVAELITLKRILTTNKKALVILPFVSVSREKVVSLQKIFDGIGVKVGGFMGGYSPPGGLATVRVAVCTIEKANNIVNRLIEEERLSELGIVVVDEMHLISDPHRGYLLELLLTKLLLFTNVLKNRRQSQCAEDDINIQIVAMSASLSTLPVLGTWLHAAVYTTEFRPIPLTELVYTKESVYRVVPGDEVEHERLEEIDFAASGLFVKGSLPVVDNDDGVFALCFDTLLSGHASLIFCATKQRCENLAESLAKQIYGIVKPYLCPEDQWPESSADDIGRRLRQQLNEAGLVDCLKHLERSPGGLDPVLSRCVRFGVAFHHAGLTIEERDILELGFRAGHIRLLVATSTLSSGVNLPARRVIIRTLFFHGQTLDYLSYKQMVGRAGRKGVDTCGEAVLICSSRDLPRVRALLAGGTPPVSSCLLTRSGSPEASLRRALLEVIASGVVESLSDARAYLDSTLLAACQRGDSSDIDGLLSSCLDVLVDNELISRSEEMLRPTQLGRAVLASALGPVDGLSVFVELSRARRSIALDTDLHLVYLVTPIYVNLDANLDWLRYLDVFQSLSPAERRVASLVGVEERALLRFLSGGLQKPSGGNVIQLRRFYLALALHRLVSEESLCSVADRFAINRGLLQSLMQQASTYAGMVTVFCNRLGWCHLERLLTGFQMRLFFGVSGELLELMRLAPLLNTTRARALHSAGITTVAVVARSRPKHLERILQKANPFHSGEASSEDSSTQSIILPDGSTVNELELPSLLIAMAQEIIRQDLASNYGVDLPSSPPETPSKRPQKRPRLSLSLRSDTNSSKRVKLDGDTPGPNKTPVQRGSSTRRSSSLRGKVTPSPIPLTSSPIIHLKLNEPETVVEEGKSAFATPEPPQELTASTPKLNDTMTFSMMERLACVSNTTPERVFNRLSGEDLFSGQMSDSRSFSASLRQSGFEESSRQALFELVDVAKSPSLWLTFQEEFEELVTSKTEDGLHWLAIQFHWQLKIDGDSTSDACYTWYGGCGGIALRGGGTNDTSLRLDGLIITSTIMETPTMFWLPLNRQDEEVLTFLKRVLCRPRVGLIVWGLKWSLRVMRELLGIDPDRIDRFHDPGIQGWLEDPDSGLPRLVDVVPNAADTVKSLFTLGYCLDPPSQLSDWTKLGAAPADNEALFSLHRLSTAAQCLLLSMCKPSSSPSMALELEVSTLQHLATAESHGFVLNLPYLEKCQREVQGICDDLERLAHRLVGCVFNLGSPREVSNMLYQRLHLPVYTTLAEEAAAARRARRCGGFGAPQSRTHRHLPTTAAALARLAPLHPLPRIISEWRRLRSLLEKSLGGIVSACVSAARQSVHSEKHSGVVRVSSTYRTFTATGRIISVQPNLQAVPKELRFSWAALLQRPASPSPTPDRSLSTAPPEWPLSIEEVLRPYASRPDSILHPRSAFEAAEGSVLVSADFCHLELRILANLSKDPVLLPMLQTSSQDVFKLLAARWLKRAEEAEVTAEERQRAKQLCYALIYGMGVSGLADQHDITLPEAQKLLDNFMTSFYGVAEFIQRTVQSAHAEGCVRTIGGRVRLLGESTTTRANNSPSKCPEPYNAVKVVGMSRAKTCSLAKVERQAVNSMIQGSAADIAKLAMQRVEEALKRRFDVACRLVMHLHDELIYEVTPGDKATVVCDILYREMPSVANEFKMSVPLPVKVKVGSNWSDLKEMD